MQVNIFAYDYSGYGASTGQPSVRNTLADIAAAFDFLCSQYNKRPEDICLYGQSVGSGPTVHLASMLPTLAGVVLHTCDFSLGFLSFSMDAQRTPSFTVC